MQLKTKYFGSIEYEKADILHFPEGIFAFEDEKEYLLLPFEGSNGAMLCLQSVHTPALAFTTMNPFFLKPDYAPELRSEELRLMGAQQSQDLCFYVLCAVKNPVSESTVNLRCPIVINDDTHCAIQVILDTDLYNMHHPLSEFSVNSGEGASC